MAIAHLACLDGAVMPAADAVVPATDEGLLRGDGVFEVLRLYSGRPFALDEHLERLGRSAANLRLPIELAAVRADVARLLDAAAGEPDPGCLRIVLTRGGRRLLLTESLPEHAPAIRLAVVAYAPVRLLDGIKSLSYGANMLATRLAQEQGADEALLVTPHGRVLEAPTSSIFWVADGTVRTPPLSDHILASITRALAIELSGAEERSCTLDELLAADEAFLASTTRELQPVASVDGRAIGAAGAPPASSSARPMPPFAGGPVAGDLAGRLRTRILAELG
jgi:branched-chain amino acid aminotransferase